MTINMNNKVYRGFLVLLCLFAFLRVNFTCTEEDHTLDDDSISAKITSPQNGSSFEAGENIVFRLEQVDVDTQDVEVYLDGKKIDIIQDSMLPDVSPGEHKLKLVMDGKTMYEVVFHVIEAGFTLRFEASYTIRDGWDRFNPSSCWPKKGIQTTLVQDTADWREFLPKIFTMSAAWNALTASWREPPLERDYPSFPPCSRNQDARHTNNVFVDFHIKTNSSEFYSKPVQIDFESHRSYRVPAVERLIRSHSEIPRYYRREFSNIDFSKQSLLTVRGVEWQAQACRFSGCGVASIYDNLVAVYEWNRKLHVITKTVIEEAVYSFGLCAACLEGFSSVLILDYAKDLPVEFIEIP